MNYEKLKDIRNKSNPFAALLGIETTVIQKGYAEGRMKIRPDFFNPLGSVHGGCLFTLADNIGGSAAISHGQYVTTLDANYHYLAPAMDVKEVIAIAKEIKYGKNIAIYDIQIYDDKNKLLGKGTFSFFNLHKEVEL